jgi:hypothetical protein
MRILYQPTANTLMAATIYVKTIPKYVLLVHLKLA